MADRAAAAESVGVRVGGGGEEEREAERAGAAV